MEYHLKYRPRSLGQVVGQPEAVAMLRGMVEKNKVPHAILFSGGSGVGKTTLVRILKSKLECSDHDYSEVNCAKDGSIEMIRDVDFRMGMSPVNGKCRIWYWDEFQAMSKNPFAQQAALKMLEDTPRHVYFFLAATDTDKIIPAIKTRCTHVALKSLSSGILMALLSGVISKEKLQVRSAVVIAIAEQARGSAREALVLLNQIVDVPTEKEQLAIVGMGVESKKQAIDLCRLLSNPKAAWKEIAELLKAIEEDPENVRRSIRGYCASITLGGGALANRAAAIVGACYDPWYDRAAMVETCWRLFGQKK